jgi:hypothetical protein
VNTYFIYLHDDRYTVPNLDTIVARDDERARELAAKRLMSSLHYRAIELWDDERFVYRLKRSGLELDQK